MESDLIKVNKWLLPLSWFYGAGVRIRNYFFDIGLLKSSRFSIPIISVGNITVGGTGKTPLVEYLVQLLRDKHRVAVLSRGYKRTSWGYQLAVDDTPVHTIGDEPWQIHHKFPDIFVAVDKKRVHGIERLCNDEHTKDVEVILLDDAFQHRYVEPGLNILLIDYHRLITHDLLLPAGRLREPIEAKSRANVVIVTKCPHDITPLGFRVVQKSLGLHPYQDLFFSTMHYGSLKGLFTDKERSLESLQPQESVLLLTGIATPEQMKQDLELHTQQLTFLPFHDHHNFSAHDVEKMNSRFAALPSPSIAITTEKDATRLLQAKGLSQELCENLYVLPIEAEIMRGKADTFNKKILNYVLKNQRNGRVVKSKNVY